MLCVGAIGMYVCMVKRRERFHFSILKCVLFTVILTIVGVAGARLLFILENFKDYLENGSNNGGVSFFGSVYLIMILMPLVGKALGLKGAQALDASAPCVAIMVGCLRVGCFLRDCCGGWEMCMGDFCFRWPTQAIEGILDFVIMSWLLQSEENGKGKDILYPAFMLSYSTMRFFIEFFRDTPKDWLRMSHGQWFSLAAILIAIMWISISRKSMEMRVNTDEK